MFRRLSERYELTDFGGDHTRIMNLTRFIEILVKCSRKCSLGRNFEASWKNSIYKLNSN